LRINSLGKKLKKIARDSSPTITQNLFPCHPKSFFQILAREKKIILHSNCANWRRVLKGEKLAVRGQAISTNLSTFVLKS
jgi:hypothetical protein